MTVEDAYVSVDTLTAVTREAVQSLTAPEDLITGMSMSLRMAHLGLEE